jgi:hypothetical protein
MGWVERKLFTIDVGHKEAQRISELIHIFKMNPTKATGTKAVQVECFQKNLTELKLLLRNKQPVNTPSNYQSSG